jgi:hypothetical protein
VSAFTGTGETRNRYKRKKGINRRKEINCNVEKGAV